MPVQTPPPIGKYIDPLVDKEAELETELDKWLYVLKHLSTMKTLPAYLRKPI